MDIVFFQDCSKVPEIDELLEYEETIICVSERISPSIVLKNYKKGFFPWENTENFVFWWNPNPRAFMNSDQVIMHKSMRPYFNQVKFRLKIDYSFTQVIEKAQKRHIQVHGDTWISQQIIKVYTQLHNLGYAHSIEAWQDNELVGGLYGISLGRFFFGETMFSLRPNASKFTFIALGYLLKQNNIDFIDCQISNAHLSFMGCREVKRNEFLKLLKENIKHKTLKGNWSRLLKIPKKLKNHFVDDS